jgi:DNA sulfur modification protein DndC
MTVGDAPSCGSSSARFGCWTCTVVEKDNSLAALIEAGHDHLEPLADFRDRLKQVSQSPQYRKTTRRNGQQGLGPLTLEARRMLLDELLALRAEADFPLISDHEVRLIREQWEKDKTQDLVRALALEENLEPRLLILNGAVR